jgi:RNA polymerase primary sigma factor
MKKKEGSLLNLEDKELEAFELDDNQEDLILIRDCMTAEDETFREVSFHHIITKYKPYIEAMASKYYWIRDKEDLIQEGNLGLIEAIKRFNPSKNVKFKTFATPWIKKKILRAIENTSSLIRVPVYIQQINRHIRKIQQEHPDITKEALAEKLNVTPNQIGYALDVQRQVLFDEALIGNLYDQEDKASLIKHDQEIDQIFSQMSELWKVIVRERYEKIKKTSYKALSTKLGLSIKKIKQIELDMKEWLYDAYYKLLYTK